MIIEETETTSELKTVEETEKIEKIQCDVCGHAEPKDEWDGREFSIDAGIEEEYHSIQEVNELFDAYHIDIETHVIDDGYSGSAMKFSAPQKSFLEVLDEEIPIALELQEKPDKERIAMAGLKEEYAEKLGTYNFYLKNDMVHHFMYRLNVEENAEEYKHVCNECYEVIFD